jgi:mannose-6-phosphate isomerase-like protein (cupin superfamily)
MLLFNFFHEISPAKDFPASGAVSMNEPEAGESPCEMVECAPTAHPMEERAMTRRSKVCFSRNAVLRVAVLSAGVVLMLSAGIPQVQAQLPPGVTSTLLARGPFTEVINFKMQAHVGGKVDTVQVHGAADMVVAQITIEPGVSIGWHSHPGPAVVVVVTGTLTIYDGDDPTCTGRSYGPGTADPSYGEAFVDLGQGHVHDARNEGDEVVTVYVTYFDVPAPPEGRPLVPLPDYVSACSP